MSPKQTAVAFSSFLIAVAAYAGYVGVMADESTGIVAPPALESRIAKWAAITGKPTTVAGYGITDAATESWVAQYVSDNTTPMDMTNEPAFKGWTNVWHDLITNHLNITDGNPHGITPAMIGAATTGELAMAVADAVAPLVSTSTLASTIAGYSTTGATAIAISSATSSLVNTSTIQDGYVQTYNELAAYGAWRFDKTRGVELLAWGETNSGESVRSIQFTDGAIDGDWVFGNSLTVMREFKVNIGTTGGQNLYYIINTNGVYSTQPFRRVSSASTNDVAVSVTLDGTTYEADSNGDIDLGSPIFTNAYDGIARELAFTAYKSATNADAVSATAYLTATNAYYWAGIAYEAATNAGIIGTNAYNAATDAYAIAVSSLASATGAFARTEILDAFIQTNVVTKGGFNVTTTTNATSWSSASQTLNIRLADIGNALVGATITGGTITTNAGIAAIVVDNPTNAAETVLAAYTNTLPLPGCAILPVDQATSNAWITGTHEYYAITGNLTPVNLCISNTVRRIGYQVTMLSTQAVTLATNMVRIGAAWTPTGTNLVVIWPHCDAALWRVKGQAQ